MKTELFYMALVTALTGCLWIPYVLERLTSVRKISDAVGYPKSPRIQPMWAERLKKAHANAVENLIILAPLVFIAQLSGISNSMTVGACIVYFWARVIHVFAYAVAIPWVRTIAFIVGFGAQAVLGWQILVR